MKKNIKLVLIIGILVLLTIILIPIVYIHFFISKVPIGTSNYYFKNRVGTIYVDSTTGCLDICFFRTFEKLEGVDKNSFEIFTLDRKYTPDSGYAKDDVNVYCRDKILKDADASTFYVIDTNLGKDEYSYYLHCSLLHDYIEHIDQNVTLEPTKIKVISYDASMFIVLECEGSYYYVKLNPQPKEITKLSWTELQKYLELKKYLDDNRGKKLDGSGTQSFEVIHVDGSGVYWKDNDHVYYDARIIEGADSETFEVFHEKGSYLYLKDRNYVYFRGVKIDGADSQTAEYIDLGYFRDKNSVFYLDKKVEEADPETLEAFINNESKSVVRDKNYIYYRGEIKGPRND